MGKTTPAIAADSLFVDGEPGPPGAFKFWSYAEGEAPAGLNFVCPCGCKAVLGVRFTNRSGEIGATWSWNGDREKPTVTPSILHMAGCRWHGYLTDGVFQEC